MIIDPAAASPVALALAGGAGVVAISRSPATLARLAGSPITLILCAAIALLALPKIVVSYIAPCEYLQDTVSAGELMAGRSAYPTDLRPAVHAVLDARPPWAPAALRSFQASQLRCGRELEINAHPPFLTVITEPLVASLGYYAPMLVMNALTLCSIAAMLWMLGRGFSLAPRWRGWAVIACLALGSQPVLSSLRMANQSVLLAAMLTGGWYLLRQRKEGLAGAVIALAVCIKVYPAIALGALLYTRKRVMAMLAAGVVIVSSSAMIFLLYGRAVFDGYLWTAHAVAFYYRWMRNNYGLLSNVRFYVHGSEVYAAIATALSLLLVVISIIALYRARRDPAVVRDLAMALAATLMCLVSPVVWTHYFIVLTLPLFTISYYSRWWRSVRLTVVFLLLVASVNLHDATLAALSALLHTEAAWSIPTIGVLCIFAWLIQISVARQTKSQDRMELHQDLELSGGVASSQ